ncbi:MAG TPA: glycosyltransferase 61 family protein [Rhodopila sp.]|nr:glycosyltransferase 61 family protein [Rhodopila sp.]
MKSHLQKAGGLTFEPIRYSTTVRNYTLENVVLDADTLVLVKDGVTIKETAYFVPGNKSHEPTIDDDALIRLSPDEDIILGYNNAHGGYQHWLVQCVPAFDWSLRQKRHRPVRLLMPALQPWQEDFLRILGHDSVPRLLPEAGKQYLLPRIEFSEFLNGATSFRICLSLLDTTRRILKALPAFPSDHKIIYVPCANPYYGSVVNEAEIQAFVQRHGILVLDQKNLDMATRINLFRNADLVMGPHGQGLTDILFCKPGTVLWEWTPRHLLNASMNRLAQAVGARYHGDMFDSIADPERQGSWVVDVVRIAQGLAEFVNRPKHPAAGLDAATPQPATAAGKPVDELMMAFESLGINCEFGLMQRHAGVEPLGLLRFAAMMVPMEVHVEKLVDALERRFEGLGTPGTITVYPTPENGEFMARESVYNLQYHTGMYPREITAEELQVRETKRLNFLRRKFAEDLEAGEKIWVWQSEGLTRTDQILPLLKTLRAIGPNKLLWVVTADDAHPPGTAECLEPDFFKGYIQRPASLRSNLELSAFSWIGACQSVYDLCFPPEIIPAPVVLASAVPAPVVPAEAAPERPPVNDLSPPPPREITDEPGPRTLSGMAFLAQNPATVPANPGPAAISRPSGLGGLLSAAFRRVRGQRP